MGSERNLIVHADDGLDELSTTCPTAVVEVFAGLGFDRRYSVDAAEFGPGARTGGRPAGRRASARTPPSCGGCSTASRGRKLDVVLLNAGAALYIAEAAPSIAAGIEAARAAVSGGAAGAKLDALIAVSRRLKAEEAA